MAERRVIVDGLKLKYKGLFNVEELYKLIDHWFREKAYTKHELVCQEQVFKDGREIKVVKEPYKKITDYAKFVINVTINISSMKDVTIERDSKKLNLNDASLSYEPESSPILGYGFRCGFLGLLHLDIVRERLEREFYLSLVVTIPGVRFVITKTSGQQLTITNPDVGLNGRRSN